MAIVVTSSRSRIRLTLPASWAEAAAAGGDGGSGLGARLTAEQSARIAAEAERAAGEALAAAAGGLEVIASPEAAAAGDRGSTGSAGAAAGKGRGRAGSAGGGENLFGWLSSVATRVATRAFLVVAGLEAIGGALRRIHESAQQDAGWRRMVDAGQRLGDSFVGGLLGSQIIVAGIQRAAGGLEAAANALDAAESEEEGVAGALAWAGGAWTDVTRAFTGFVDHASALGTILVGRFELGILALMRSIEGAIGAAGIPMPNAKPLELGRAGGAIRAREELYGPGEGNFRWDLRGVIDRVAEGGESSRPPTFRSRLPEHVQTLAERLEDRCAAVDERIAAAEARLTGGVGPGTASGPGGGKGRGPGTGRAGAAGSAPPSSPAAAARVATQTGIQRLLERIRAWTTGGPGTAIFDGLQRISSAADGRLSDMFASARATVAALKAQVETAHATLVPVLASTEALAGAFATLSGQLEAIGESDARVARANARIRLGLLAATAAVQASIETAAGIAAAISLRVAEAILHFTSAASFAAAAVLAGGRAAGAIGRTPSDARAIAQGQVDSIVGGVAGGAGGRLGSIVLVVHGDADLEDEAWLRANVLDPIAKGTPPANAGTDGLRGLRVILRGAPSTAQVVRQAILEHTRLGGKEGSYGGAIGAVIGLIIGGPTGMNVGLQIGYQLDAEIRRARRRVQRELSRIGRRLKKIF